MLDKNSAPNPVKCTFFVENIWRIFPKVWMSFYVAWSHLKTCREEVCRPPGTSLRRGRGSGRWSNTWWCSKHTLSLLSLSFSSHEMKSSPMELTLNKQWVKNAAKNTNFYRRVDSVILMFLTPNTKSFFNFWLENIYINIYLATSRN